MHVCSFAPLGTARATRLILGTMPGRASLDAGQYYAHPRNAFWPIIEELTGLPAGNPYPARVRALEAARIALWDVLAACFREGSLDSDIDLQSARPNDFAGFLAAHPRIDVIYFNGQPARRLFERLVHPMLPEACQRLARVTLPSTSPANARHTLADKRRAWSIVAASG
ncbi:MAG: DNA-deoxyinosine glycosylase [Steroidobacteraceae bacterium]